MISHKRLIKNLWEKMATVYSKKLSDFYMAGEEVGKKLKEESQGNYKK